MYYTTDELAKILRYKNKRTFLQALRNKTNFIINTLIEAGAKQKTGQNRMMWKKDIVDKVLNQN